MYSATTRLPTPHPPPPPPPPPCAIRIRIIPCKSSLLSAPCFYHAALPQAGKGVSLSGLTHECFKYPRRGPLKDVQFCNTARAKPVHVCNAALETSEGVATHAVDFLHAWYLPAQQSRDFATRQGLFMSRSLLALHFVFE